MSLDLAIHSIPVPEASMARRAYPVAHLADAFEVRLPAGTVADPRALARFVFETSPPWIDALMRVRDAIVGVFGLKTAARLRRASDGRIGLFKVYASTPNEVLLGEDDSHLDFRVSVLHRPALAQGDGDSSLVVATVVHCHNLGGRLYIALIRPFHVLVVRGALRRAARRGWPMGAPGAAAD